MWQFLLTHEGAPMLVSRQDTVIRKAILEWPDDDADLWQVFSVPSENNHAIARDVTKQFAKTWALDFDFLEGADPLAAYPAFVREAIPELLAAQLRTRSTRTSFYQREPI